MKDIKFRQRNLNNSLYYYWGLVDGIWQNPKIQDNYIHPMDSKQYTGQKDKNGVEIYEDDIIEFRIYPNERFRIAIIKWYKYGYTIENQKGQFVETTINAHILFLNSETNIKVVGNVHVNPELLESHT